MKFFRHYDKHLDVKISVVKEDNDSAFITNKGCYSSNLLGKAYIRVVEPIHTITLPSTIKRAEFSEINA